VLPDDNTTGELEHGLVVLWLLLPANEQSSEAVDPRMHAFDYPAANVGNLVESHLLVVSNRYHNRPLLCFVYVGLKQNCEALQLLRISELHELHFALSNGCGINRFREATIIDKTGWRLTLPGRPRCDGLFQNVGCDRDSSTCRHVKSIDAAGAGLPVPSHSWRSLRSLRPSTIAVRG
jgi:hypothetical protein